LERVLTRRAAGEPQSFRASIVAGGALAAVLAVGSPCRADDDGRFSFPRLQDTKQLDGQDYSYYYVPHLAELNQLVGYLFRTGLVRKDAPEAAATIKRYAAYSCEGTMYVGAGAEPRASEDIDWSTVTTLHAGPAAAPPSLVIERAPPLSGAAKPLVLYVPDATIRYQLHQALAVLVSECRPRNARETPPPREQRGE
jgi:hypothetical protein